MVSVPEFQDKSKFHKMKISSDTNNDLNNEIRNTSNVDSADNSDIIDNNGNQQDIEYREFNEEFFVSMPLLFSRLASVHHSKVDKLMMTLGSITAISSVLPNYGGIYGNKWMGPNLYFYVLAKAGAGKGKLTWVKKLVEPVSHFFNTPQVALDQISRIDATSVKNLIESVTNDTRFQSLIIPGNVSSAAFIQLLQENNGKGFMMETEGDTIANMLASDYGNYSDMFRKAYEHETISYARKTDSQRVYVEHPQLSVIVSSTPKQLHRLIADAENGLFSRFAYMTIPSSPDFKNVFDDSGYDEIVKAYEKSGEEILRVFLMLSSKQEVMFSLTKCQQAKFLEHFGGLKSAVVNFLDEKLEGSVHRLASIFFRIAMVQSIFRYSELDELPDMIVCNDVDFENTLLLSSLLVNQMIEVYNTLPNAEVDKLAANKASFYRALPIEFTSAEAKVLASEFDMGDRTVERFLKNNTKLFEKVKHGRYRKLIA